MPDLIHTSDALNVLDLFLSTDHVVYVEGQDDVVFWNRYFRKVFPSKKFSIQPVGGDGNLDIYIARILQDDAKVFVATDRDYKDIVGDAVNHNRVIYTYGYSIENSMYCPENVAALVAKYNRESHKEVETCTNWSNSYSQSASLLLAHDLANRTAGMMLDIVPENSMRLLKTGTSDELSEEKIREHLLPFGSFFRSEDIEEALRIMSSSGKSLHFFIRGHFLTNSVINHIKKNVKTRNVSISNESLFVSLVDGCDECFATCEDWPYYEQVVKAAFS